ncbi:MAG TPA: ABC transporter permease [Myxococcota bacterium]|nr:ABC transporter permease [Myxococcota bacterium]
MIWRLALKVFYRNFLVWKRYYWMSFVEAVGEPILYFVAIGFGLGAVIGEIDGRPYIEFLSPALIATSIMFGSSLETTYGSFTRLKIEKVFQSIAVTPVSLREVIAGEILWGASKGLVSGIVMLLVVGSMGLVHSWMAIGVIPLLVLEALFFSSLGMMMTAYARDYSVFVVYITLGLESMFLFSGTFFPLSSLPAWAQGLAWSLPLTPIVSMARGLFDGAPPWSSAIGLLGIAAATALLVAGSMAKISRRLID